MASLTKMKTVLLTGGTGFIGSHVVEAILKQTDWTITLLDRFDETSTPHRITDMECYEANKQRIKFVFWDLKAPINSFTAQKMGFPNYVLHLAASTHVDRSITDPTMFVMDNVVGTLNLLEWAKGCELWQSNINEPGHPTKIGGIEKFNYFSTDEVMGSAPEGINYKETDMARPENPYAAAKLGGEALCQAFACTYTMPIFITRTMNVCGERQHPEKFIPMSIRKIRDGETNIIHANKDLTKAGSRYYIHARNVASALIFLLQSDEPMLSKENRNVGIYNIVGEKELDNKQMVELLASFVGKPAITEMVDFHSSRPGHDLRYALDGSKLKSLGFDYPKTLEESMKKMVGWYLAHPEWLDIK